MSHDSKITCIIDVAHESVTTFLQEEYRNGRLPRNSKTVIRRKQSKANRSECWELASHRQRSTDNRKTERHRMVE